MGPRTREQRLFALLVGSSVLFFVAQGILLPVLPRYVSRELGGGGFAVGVAVSSFAIGALVARPFGGLASDRVGRRAVVTFGSLLWAAMVTLYPVAGSAFGVPGVVGVRVIGGLGGGALFVASAAIAADLWPEERRVQGFAMFSMSTLIGFAFGPSLGELLLGGDRWGLTFVVCGVLALAPAAAMVVMDDTRRTTVRGPRPPLFHRAAARPGIGLMLGSLGFITFAAFVPVHADEIGMRHLWVVLFLNPATTLVVRFLGSRVADSIPRRTLTGVSLSFVLASALILALWPSPTAIYLAALCNGTGSAFVYPGFMAMTIDRTPEPQRAQAIGSLTMFSDIASSAGGALLGAAADAWGYQGAFGLAAACAAGSITVLAVSNRPALPRTPGAPQPG